MDHSQDLIRYYLQGIRHVTSATSVALYVPAPSSISAHTLLVHEGEDDAIPEFISRETASDFGRRTESGQFEQITDIEGLEFFLGPQGTAISSNSDSALLCPLLLGLGALGLPELKASTTTTPE